MTQGVDAAAKETRPGASPAPGRVLLEIEGLTKRFSGTAVLDGVSLRLRAGEVRALLGENGAGKSTLINILSGVHRPSEGTLRLDGRPLALDGPADAHRRGIVTIHQEFSLFPDMTVAETIFAGKLPTNRLGLIAWKALTRRSAEILAQLGARIDPGRRVGDLSVAEQQLVEIARALTTKPRILILDEPTASLTPQETEHLTTMVRAVAWDGVAVIYVSHRLEEVKAVAETFTVLRDGRVAAEGAMADASLDDLVRWMIGRLVASERRVTGPRSFGAPVLEVEGLSAAGAAGAHPVRDIGFTVHAGEIVGLAGLVGAGRTEIARMLFGAERSSAGAIRLNGRPFRPRSPRQAIAAGVALVPEDRKQQALFLSLAARENFAVPGIVPARRFGILNRGAERLAFDGLSQRLRLRAAAIGAAVGTLSGGNQQKVVLARWLALSPRLLIVDEPTRGVDIGAKADLHQLLRDLAADGVAILLISSDLTEILALSDRILTLRAGRLTGELPGAEADEESLMRLMTLAPRAA